MIGKKRFLKRSVKMAKDAGFHNSKYAGMWEGNYVYEPVFSDEEVHIIGIPQFMIVENERLRWTKTAGESFSIMHALH